MAASQYEDRSYAPIGSSLIYRRGDGATVTINVTDGARPQRVEPTVGAARSVAVARPRHFDPFADDVPPAVLPAVPLAPPTPLQLAPGIDLTPVKRTGTSPTDDAVFDHPAVGGKFTIFVLLYGPSKFHQLHKQCLDAIIGTVPQKRFDLRVGSNELCQESLRYVESYVQAGIITKHYRHAGNDRKYPVMREMFRDPALPIDTQWLLWFDDDSIADRNRDWLRILCGSIAANPDVAMFGGKMYYQLTKAQIDTYRSRPWFRGKAFRNKQGQAVPNGNCAHFAHGGFWALRTNAMRACDVPDANIGHNGGDYTIGEQLYQGGFTIKSWNGQKQYVHTSSVPRRGLSEPHFGTVS